MSKTSKQRIEELLGLIHEQLVSDMLEDLKDPERRSPQLYNAIIKELDRNGVDIVLRAGENEDNPMAQLLKATKQAYEQDYGMN